MDPRLIHFYNEELQRLRGEAVEFAEEYRSAAGMLKLQDGQVADPYVERLLEGVAYLSARVRLKLDSQFPDFTQQLLEVLFPGWQAPVPSVCIVQLRPLLDDPRLHRGWPVPRKTLVVGSLPAADVRCEFETTSTVDLWPLQLTGLQYRSRPDERQWRPSPALATRAAARADDADEADEVDPEAVGPPAAGQAKALLRLELALQADELTLGQLPLERLRFYVGSEEPQASQLMELLGGRCLGVCVSSDADGKRHTRWLPAAAVRHAGLSDADALMPMPVRGHVGFRLLREYAAVREKFQFIDVCGLRAALRGMPGRRCFLQLFFSADYPRLEKSLKADALKLYCTPAVNLRERALERLDVVPGQMDYQIVVDKHRVQAQEIVQVLDVRGGGPGIDRRFAPLYEVAANGRLATGSFYALRRTRRLITEREAEARRRWARGVDTIGRDRDDAALNRPPESGAEVFMALAERGVGPPAPAVHYLSIRALCMDREAPRWLRAHPAEAQYELQDSLPAERVVQCVLRPTQPAETTTDGFDPWVALSWLSTNYLSLVDGGDRPSAQALRGLLSLFCPGDDHFLKAQADALQAIHTEPVVRRLPPAPAVADPDTLAEAAESRSAMGGRARGRQALLLAHGFRVSLAVSERGFEGGSPFVLGAMLAAYLQSHVGVNSFVETELGMAGWAQPLRWAAAPGQRPAI
ncbi:MAG: type VI secretion system baseplate subunit TssF [Rubrivivax sp.]